MVTHLVEPHTPSGSKTDDKVNYVTTIINNTKDGVKVPVQADAHASPAMSRLSTNSAPSNGLGARNNGKALSDTDADSFILDIQRYPSVRRMTANGFLIPADDASSNDPRSSIDGSSILNLQRNGSHLSISDTTAVEHTDGKDEVPSSPEPKRGAEDEDLEKPDLYHRRTGRTRSLSVDTRPKIRFSPARQLRPVKSILINHEKTDMLDDNQSNLVQTDPETPLPGRASFNLERTRSFVLASQTLANTHKNTLRSAWSSSDTDTTTTVRTVSTPSVVDFSTTAAPEDPMRNLILCAGISLAFLVLLSAGKEVLYVVALLPVLFAFVKHYPEIQKTLAPLMK
jgi:hypothetical protein